MSIPAHAAFEMEHVHIVICTIWLLNMTSCDDSHRIGGGQRSSRKGERMGVGGGKEGERESLKSLSLNTATNNPSTCTCTVYAYNYYVQRVWLAHIYHTSHAELTQRIT